MPKNTGKLRGGGGRGGQQRNNYEYYDHDDRVFRNYMVQEHHSRRHFQMTINPPIKSRLSYIGPSLPEFYDCDVPSKEANNGPRKIRKNYLRNIPIHRQGVKQKHIGESNDWYRVTIPYVRKYGKDEILGKVQRHAAPKTFVPLIFDFRNDDATFLVDSQNTAKLLRSFHRKIELYDGFRLQIRVNSENPPTPEINNELKERLKLSLEKRYLPERNALNLSKFYEDPDLAGEFLCAFSRPAILMAVLDIVEKHIPQLEALNLDSNKLSIIERLHVLSIKFPNLKILHVGDNLIREISQLNVLKDLQLEELRLEGNPVCGKFKEKQDDYASIVRNIFPRLLRLDGKELQKPIVFDDVSGGKIPKTQRLYFPNIEAHEIASNFLQLYFQIFDSDNRQLLLQAYHEQACFSLTVPPVSMVSTKFSSYYDNNRNLCRVADPSRRQKLLKQGKLPIVSLMSELPRTSHDLSSFTMDITIVTDSMMMVIVQGLFHEISASTNKETLRFFNRTFTIVPEGSGYCIRNEQLFICNPSNRQSSKARKAQHIVPSICSNNDEMKMQMTLTLSQQTNMNLKWSCKCLEDVQWSYEKALNAFQECFALGQVPAEAFVK